MAKKWYVIHTYSGYENKVKANLEHRIESMGMADKIFEVLVPKETVTELKAGGRKVTSEKRVFPGYSLVQMGHGIYQKRIQATVTSETRHIAVEIASDKEETNRICADLGLPVAEQRRGYDE